MSDTASIDGSLLRLKREERGWATTDMATKACLSVKQVRQLEEGGTSAFYSESVKLTAARKVAQMLGITEEALFGRQPVIAQSEPVDQAPTTAAHIQVDLPTPALNVRSQALHELAQPPEHPEAEQVEDTPQAAHVTPADVAPAETPSSNNGLKVAVLFVVALAAAAFFSQQQTMTPDKAEPPAAAPAAEVVPAPASPAADASAAPAAASAVSAAAVPSAASAPASAAAPVAAPASTATGGAAGAAPVAAKPASPVAVPAPAQAAAPAAAAPVNPKP